MAKSDENMAPTAPTDKPSANKKSLKTTETKEASNEGNVMPETASQKRSIGAVETVHGTTASEPSNSKRTRSEETEVLDLANMLSFKPGDRFEVNWEIIQDEDGNTSSTPQQRWWGATLLEHDGRTEDSVAIRVLDYDPYPEGGFSERSREDVIFLGRDMLIDPCAHQEMEFRREGDEEDNSSPLDVGRQGIEEVVNDTLSNAFQKNSASWNSLSRSQQASVADVIRQKKEKLVQILLSQPDGVITSTTMQDILARTMHE